MRRKLQTLAGVAAITLVGGGAYAEDNPAGQRGQQSQAAQAPTEQQGQPQSASAARGQSQGQSQEAPDGFVLIEERVVFLMGQEPQQHLLSSLEELHQNDTRAAAGEIRQAAAYVEMQASRAKGEGRQELNDAAQQLNQLAKQIATNTQKVDAQQVTRTFAQTGHALAKHHQILAKQALEKDRQLAAGYELEAAAQAVKQAVIWSGQQPKDDLVNTLQGAIVTAYELRNEQFPADPQQQQQAQGQRQQQQQPGARAAEGEAQTASAKQSGDQLGDPRVGTTRAERQNIQQHAKKVIDELDKDIQQLGQAIQQSGGQQQQGRDPSQPSGQSQQSQDARQQPQQQPGQSPSNSGQPNP